MHNRSAAQTALVVLIPLSVVVYTALALSNRVIEGDTTILVQGARGVATCLANFEFRGCSRPTSGFPVLQYLIALTPIAAGASDGTVLLLFGIVSTLAIPAGIAAAWWAGRAFREQRWSTVLAVGFATSPLIAYGASTFREATATLTIVVALGVTLHRCRGLVVAGAIAVACLHQDTAALFMVPLALLAARDDDDRLLPRWSRTASILIGAGAALLLTAAANQLRFGTFSSVFTGSEWRTPMSWIPEMYVSLVAAPNGGLIPFWPAASLLLIVFAVATVRRLVRDRSALARWLPPLVLLAIVAGHILMLAAWWSPFGWFGWGPRLSIPFTAGFCVVAARMLDADATPVFDRVGNSRALAVSCGLVMSIAALPHVAFVFAGNQARYIASFFLTGDASCPQPIGDHTGDPATVAYYYDCVIWHRSWHRRRYVLVDMLTGTDWSLARATVVALFTTTVVLAVVVGLRPREHSLPPSDGAAATHSL